MDDLTRVLMKLGLQEQEVKTYLALLDLNEATATKLAENTGLGRVHMYQILNKLMDKGLASLVIKNNVKYFLAAEPENLLKDLHEKEKELLSVLPMLKARQEQPLPEIKVEVYKGVEGFKSVLNDRLKVGGDVHSFGVDESLFKTKFGTVIDQFFRQEKEQKLKEFIITSEKVKFTYEHKHIHYRFISEKFFDPTPTAIYADRVMIIIWEPLTTILIRNKNLADSYRKHFSLLWKMAKEG